jgi:hypothetical protein
MKQLLSRRRFVKDTIQTGAVLTIGSLMAAPLIGQEKEKKEDRNKDKKKAPKRPPALEPDLVNQFVRYGHTDLDKVKAMLEKEPALVNATWDWGGGDFETALGGAAHMGRRDIALYLLDYNARIDIYAAAMLGKLDIVKALVKAFPGIHKVPGPHNIPLIAHAEKGGEEAKEVLEFLKTL